MRINTGVKITGSGKNQQVEQQNTPNDFIPQVAGTIGGTLGQILGGAADVASLGVAAPVVNPITGGAALGGVAQGGAQALQNLFTGQKWDQNVGQEAGQGAAFGAIPGGAEAKGFGLLTKAALKGAGKRMLAGGAAGAASQALQNSEGGNQGSVIGSGLFSGALNAVAPGAARLANIPSRAINALGRNVSSSAGKILERNTQPELDAVQMLFGKKAIATGGGKSFVHPDVHEIMTKFPALQNLPPNGDLSQFGQNLKNASQQVEKELQPILKNPQYSVGTKTLNDIVDSNLKTFFGDKSKTALSAIPNQLREMLSKPNLAQGSQGAPVNLSDLKTMQRLIGQVGGEGDWAMHPANNELEKWARSTYKQIGDLYEQQLSKADNTQYKNLINQHKVLLKAQDATGKALSGSGTLPLQLTNEEAAKDAAQRGLSGERQKELATRNIVPLTSALAALGFIPGLPPGVKTAADIAAVGTGAYGLSQFGPHMNPEVAQKVGQKMQGVSQINPKILTALQQLGIRLPEDYNTVAPAQ